MIPTGVHDPDDPHDAWALTNSGYALDKFYCRASDSNGHSELVHVKLSPNARAMLNMLVGDESLPYKTQADVLRDALTHRIHFILDAQKKASNIGQADAGLWQLWRTMVYANQIEEARAQRAENQRALEMTWEELQTLMNRKQTDRAWELVDYYEDTVLDHVDADDRKFGASQVEQMRAFIEASKAGKVAVMPRVEEWGVK
jgi:hypothetical protein